MKETALNKQIAFLMEVDKLKSIYRQTYLIDGSRKENDAEHSWHLALMAILLPEYAPDKDLNLLKVLKMVIIHDLVEIDAGDTYCYDEISAKDKSQREELAAARLFGMLPNSQKKELLMLWEEFEERITPEAKYASALDRLQPLIHNYITKGKSWLEHGITSPQVYDRNKHIEESCPALWEYAKGLIQDSIEQGYLQP